MKKKFRNLRIIEWSSLQKLNKNYDIVINATSLGLRNRQDFNFSSRFTKKRFDIYYSVYNPLETKTLKFLKEKDIKVFNGLDMFIYQGQKSFYLWNKDKSEIDQG